MKLKPLVLLSLLMLVFVGSNPLVHAASWHDAETWNLSIVGSNSTFTYVVHGPYLESGTVYNGIVNCTLAYVNQQPSVFSLDGTSGTAQTVTFTNSPQAYVLNWNITTGYSYSRMYVYRNDTYDEFWVYVGGSGDILAQYTVTVTDFAGLTNATVELDRNIGGFNRIVERQNLDVSNGLIFWLLQYNQYSLKVVSSQGSWAWSFPADNVLTKNFIITRDMVSEVSTVQNSTVTATRTVDGTVVNVYFNDASGNTAWVNSTVYLANSTGWFYVTSQYDVGNLQNFATIGLDATEDYEVTVSASQNGLVNTWNFNLPTSPATTNMWTGIFDMFGVWPFDVANAVGMFIVLAFFAVGSWKDTEFFLGAGILVAAFLTYVGMMNVPWLGISVALMFVFLMQIAKGKRESGDF